MRDLAILALVESFRLLTSAHLQALVEGSNQGILRRLQKLFHAGYLDRLQEAPVYGGGSPRMVYAVTNRGIRAFEKSGLIERPTTTDRNANNRGLRDLSIRHTLLVAHIRAVLTLENGPVICRTNGSRKSKPSPAGFFVHENRH